MSDDWPDLFDDLPPYARGSDTSREAAESMVTDANRLRLLVYQAIKGKGSHGFTCDEVEVELQLRHQTASARINELHNRRWIVDSGRRRQTRSGRNAVVWVVFDDRLDVGPPLQPSNVPLVGDEAGR